MTDWSMFYSRLMNEKKRLDQEIKNLNHMNLSSSLTDSINELSAYDNHPADLGSETFEREKDLGILDALRIKMKNVDHALERLDTGEYGLCESCGSEIPTDRLDALPETSFCINCQKEVEELTSERERPLEEEVLGPPFGRSFLDDCDNVGTDGEDVWQEVARYGTSETPQDIGGGLLYEEMYHGNEENSLVEEVDGIISEEFPEGIPPDPSP